MSNFDSIKIPKISNTSNHFINQDTYYFTSFTPPSFKSVPKNQSFILKKDTRVTVLEHAVGHSALWCKINIDGIAGEHYVLSEHISGDLTTKKFVTPSLLSFYHPNTYLTPFEWRGKEEDIILENYYNGEYYIIYDTRLETINNNLDDVLYEYFIKSLSKILNHFGKKSDLEYVKSLQEKYYFFGKLVAIDYAIRNCSTLKVVVSIPMSYVHSEDIYDLLASDSDYTPEDVPFEDDPQIPEDDQEDPPEENHEYLKFSSSVEFDDYFKKIINFDIDFTKWGLFNKIDLIYSSVKWTIDPEQIFIDFKGLMKNIEDTKKSIIEFVLANIPIDIIPECIELDEFQKITNEDIAKVILSSLTGGIVSQNIIKGRIQGNEKFKKAGSNPIRAMKNFGLKNALEVVKFFKKDISSVKWNGDLSIKIDLETYTIVDITFKPNPKLNIFNSLKNYKRTNSLSKKIKFTRSNEQFFQSTICRDSTIINYLSLAYKNILEKDNDFYKLYYFQNFDITKLYGILDEVSSFIKFYHIPEINEITPNPIDLTKCLTNDWQLVKDIESMQSIQALKSWKKALEKDLSEQYKVEGNILLNWLNGVKQNPNLSILLGEDAEANRILSQDPLKWMRTKLSPALKELNIYGIIAELIKCATIKLSPEDFESLIAQYNEAKIFLEAAAFSTACNPFAQNFAKDLKFPEIPLIETYNPNRNLANELTKYFVKLTQDLLLAGLRELLKAAMNLCASDPNQEANAGNISNNNALADALANPEDPAAINDILDNLFPTPSSGVGAGKTGNPREDARTDLGKIVDDFSCFLTIKEMCDLLSGKTVSDEAYQIMLKTIQYKYPHIHEMNFLTTREDIKRLFLAIGNNIDIKLCNDIISAPTIPISCACDDGVLEQARKTILDNKGLPPAAVNDILEDIRRAEKLKVNDMLKWLNGEQPDISNLPSSVCKKTPDGQVIPPIADLSPSLEDFRNLLKTLLNDIYDTFDDEARNWSKSTYSISSAAPPVFTFDRENGKLSPSDKISNDIKVKYEILPSYIFKDIFNNFVETGSYSYSCIVDGEKQKALDVNIIGEDVRQNVINAENNLSIFLRELMGYLNSFISIVTAELVVSSGISIVNSLPISKLLNIDVNIVSDILNSLGMIDSFLRNTKNNLGTEGFQSEQQNTKTPAENLLPTTAEASSLYLMNSGNSLYMSIASFLHSKQKNEQFEKFMTAIGNQLYSRIQQNQNLPFGNIDESSIGNFIKKYKAVCEEYERVEKYFNLLFSTSFNFPTYKILYQDNFIKQNITALDQNNLNYEVYRLNILKNEINYLSFDGYNYLSENAASYLDKSLSSTSGNLDKKEVYKKYIEINNPNITLNDYPSYEFMEDYFQKLVFNSIFKNNLLLDTFKVVTASIKQEGDKKIETQDIIKPYTDYFALVLQDSKKAEYQKCNIRPHYLEIDQTKEDIESDKKMSMCIEEIVNDKIRNNKPVSSSELKEIKLNDTQNSMLNHVFLLTLRMYIHDVLLKGIGVFGYYDPQYLRDESLFINFIHMMVKSDMRGVDANLYDTMERFFINKNNLENPDKHIELNNLFAKNELIKNIIKEQLNKFALPKLTKRILDNTNKNILNAKKNTNDKNLIVLNRPNSIFDIKKIIFDENIIDFDNNVYFKIYKKQYERWSIQERAKTITDSSEEFLLKSEKDSDIFDQNTGFTDTTKFIDKSFKIFNGKTATITDTSAEYEIFFEYLFPIKKYITLAFITNVMSTQTRTSILNTFRGTKNSLRRLCKSIITNGQPLAPDPNNPQDIANAKEENSANNFWFDALVKAPLMIVKGFMEVADPNVALSSAQYKIAKSFIPDYPSWSIPTVGIPLGITAYFIPAIFPFRLDIYNGAYYASGLWNDDIWKTPEKDNVEDAINKLAAFDIDCDSIKNHNDIIKLDNEGYVMIEEKI